MVVGLALVVLGLSGFGGVPEARGAPPTGPVATAGASPSPALTGHIDVAQINGLIDPIQVDFLRHAIAGAQRGGAEVLIVQLDSGGGVVSASVLHQLVASITASPVPVGVWVGPNGSRAFGAAFAILQAAPLRGMAPATTVGDAIARSPNASRRFDPGQAAATGIATINEPTLGDFVVNLDGRQVDGTILHTAKVVHLGGELRREPTVGVRFEGLNLFQQLFHTAASPSVAYLMLLIGLLLIAMEFFTAGIGIGAVAGTGALVLSSYGLGVLPVHLWAVLLLVAGAFGFCVDLQAGVPRAWTFVGAGCLLVGSIWLYHGGIHASILALAAGLLGTPLFMVAGMPAMIRARFSTPTIGRQSLIGEMGVALAAIAPEGTVEVRGAPWQARTNRATPIKQGDPIRVVSIDGLLLEVEPETGGARDAHH